MNRLRLAAVGFFSLVILLTLGVIVYVENSNSSHVVTVWVVQADSVPAGSPYSDAVVQQTQIHGPDGEFTYQTQGPDSQPPSVFTITMQKGDIVRPNDLAPQSAFVDIAITATGSTGDIGPGDLIDIYTQSGTGTVRIGRAVSVVAGAGGNLTIAVPQSQEQAWVVVTSSQAQLHVVKTFKNGDTSGGGAGIESLTDALSQLEGQATGGQ